MAEPNSLLRLDRNEYASRRQKFADALKQNIRTDSPILYLLKAPSVSFSAPDVPNIFRQDANFLYLTGLKEPESIFALRLDGENVESHLFVSERDAKTELWDGPSPGVPGALALTGVENVSPTNEFPIFLDEFANSSSETILSCDIDKFSNLLPHRLSQKGSRLKHTGQNGVEEIHRLRWIKSPAEQALMREAGRIGAAAMAETIKFSQGGMEEYALASKMELESRIRGAQSLSYPPVIAGGDRANTIHYLVNDQRLHTNEMVLMDAGCDYHGYVSDITRTWPVGGSFLTPAHQEAHEALLEVHLDLLEFVNQFRPLILRDIHFRMLYLLGKKLRDLGVFKSSMSDTDAMQAADRFCPHHVSHYLGMDVHDTATVPRNIEVPPGVCITVEPGLYFPAKDRSLPEELRGIGMRIEDDVLITETGAEVLSQACPRGGEELLNLVKD